MTVRRPPVGGEALRYSDLMAGAVVIVLALLLFPVFLLLGGAVLAALFGETLARDGDKRYEGSELVELGD